MTGYEHENWIDFDDRWGVPVKGGCGRAECDRISFHKVPDECSGRPAMTDTDDRPTIDEYVAALKLVLGSHDEGWRLVKGDGLSHGDVLERVRGAWHDPQYEDSDGVCFMDFHDSLRPMFARVRPHDGHTVAVGPVHVLDDGGCVDDCPHPDHERSEPCGGAQ